MIAVRSIFIAQHPDRSVFRKYFQKGSEGMKQRIERFIDRLSRERVNIHGFLLNVNGREIAKAYYAPFREGAPHRLYSVSKTMTGLAVGMLADAGKLRLDQPVCDFFQDWLPGNPDSRLTRLTLCDMLRMSTCFTHTAYREGVDENWARAFFTVSPTHEPGTVFCYDTGASQVLSALVRRVSGQEVIDFLEERLFTPLGLKDNRYWLRDPSGCCQGGTGLCMSLRDMHKIAQCLLDGGNHLVPAWFVEQMQQKHIETPMQPNEEERYGYGWQCWRTRAGWTMYGMGGQLAVLCPQKRALLSTVADTRLDPFGVQRIYNAFFEELYPFLDGAACEPMTFSLQIPALENKPAFAVPESGRYVFGERNGLGLKWLQLSEHALTYENSRGVILLPLVPETSMEIAYPGWPGVPALLSTGWADQGLLRVRCDAIGDAPCGFDMLLQFRDQCVTVQCRRSNDPLTDGYEGVASGYPIK